MIKIFINSKYLSFRRYNRIAIYFIGQCCNQVKRFIFIWSVQQAWMESLEPVMMLYIASKDYLFASQDYLPIFPDWYYKCFQHIPFLNTNFSYCCTYLSGHPYINIWRKVLTSLEILIFSQRDFTPQIFTLQPAQLFMCLLKCPGYCSDQPTSSASEG